MSPREAQKKFFAFIFQLSGWTVVAPSWFAPQVPDVRGSMLHTHAERRRAAIDLVDTCPVDRGLNPSRLFSDGAWERD